MGSEYLKSLAEIDSEWFQTCHDSFRRKRKKLSGDIISACACSTHTHTHAASARKKIVAR